MRCWHKPSTDTIKVVSHWHKQATIIVDLKNIRLRSVATTRFNVVARLNRIPVIANPVGIGHNCAHPILLTAIAVRPYTLYALTVGLNEWS
jgi:hypothetical protein